MSAPAKIKALVRHLIQMIVAMEIGMVLYMLFANRLAPARYRAIIKDNPFVGYWIMIIMMTLPMIALMRYHQYI